MISTATTRMCIKVYVRCHLWLRHKENPLTFCLVLHSEGMQFSIPLKVSATAWTLWQRKENRGRLNIRALRDIVPLLVYMQM